ncbi:MAG: hypothetical protein QOK44_5010 [Betaproteobacteria bacterium]|nr:hypothetical protein [Betaproteobacteria bacterium]
MKRVKTDWGSRQRGRLERNPVDEALLRKTGWLLNALRQPLVAGGTK